MNRTVALFRLLAFYLILFTVLRLGFFFVFRGDETGVQNGDLMRAFWLGARYDLRLSLILILPLALLGAIPALNWSRDNKRRNTWIGLQTALSSVVLIFYFLDFGHYSYLKSRISASIFDFLKNPMISLEMMWESYNLPLITLAVVLLCAGFYFTFDRWVFRSRQPVTVPAKRLWSQTAVVVLFFILGLHGSFSQYPLRWSEAFFSANSFVSAVALNPIHYLVDTMTNVNTLYDKELVQKDYDTVAAYLGVQNPDREKLNFHRPVQITDTFSGRPNVIYVVMESFAAYKTGTFGNPLNASPAFDSLAKEGILFRHFYTPTEGTARSMFCALTGLPDINAESTSSRNPLVVDQHTLVNAFKDYQKFFFIGGSATWGNIRGVYQNNVYDLQMYEEEDFDRPRTDVWGLSDLDLFKEAARILKEKAKNGPFFAFVQSASYHRPYTIPAERDQFELLKPTDEELKKAGFHSAEEFNSFRFSDYSLGRFIEILKEDPVFANTVVVIHGDHGLPHNDAEHLPAGYRFFGLSRFHVPLLFVSPKITTPAVVDTMTSETDVMATLAGSTGHEYTNTTLGQNIFAHDPKRKRYAFSYVYYSEPLQVLLYDQDYIISGNPQKIEGLYQYTSTEPEKNVKDEQPEKFAEMSNLLNGLFESARWMLHHNPKLKQAN